MPEDPGDLWEWRSARWNLGRVLHVVPSSHHRSAYFFDDREGHSVT